MIVGYTAAGGALRARDLRAAGAMAVILRNALRPNLVQTSEGTPAFVHGGPFANIAHGTASLVSLRLALELADYCVVEAGFGADLGGEKFVDLVAPAGGFSVDATVVVATVRSLRYHGGVGKDRLGEPNLEALERGLPNLAQHLTIVRAFGAPAVVALNRFPGDTEEEIHKVQRFCAEEGVPCALSEVFARGGEGALDLAGSVVEAARAGGRSRPLYDPSLPLVEKVATLVRRVYGGDGVNLSPAALEDLQRVDGAGLGRAPVCIAKTHLSLSDDPKRLGRPRDFSVTVHRIYPSAGAGFVVVLLGEILTLPGLPKHPASEGLDLSDTGEVLGLR
jgi:formate--tetrahydrofolate ligase